MEPERKLPHDIEPNLRPQLGVIDGGGETTPDRPGRDTMQALPETADDMSAAESEAATGANSERHLRAVPNESTHINNVQGKSEKKSKWKGWFKKGGPALGIGGIFGISGFVLIGLTSPSLLIVQMKEVMVGKFNTQLATMETRSNKLLVSKVNGATKGFCSTRVTIACKFTTMSTKQVERLRAAGIEVQGDETITGRIRPTGLVFDGNPIPPGEFSSRATRDPVFRDALKQAYNPKYAGFVGKAWAAMSGKHKLSKQMPELDAEENPDEARAKVNEIAREGAENDTGRTRVTPSEPGCENNCVSQEEADRLNNQAEAVEEGKKSGSAGADIRSKLSGINTAGVTAAFKISAPLDYACQGYGAITMLSYMAKTIRMSQMIRYALIYFSVADAIKAGESPDPADVALLGTILTTTVMDTADNTKTLVGAGTNSFGYNYAAYGDSKGSVKSMQIANRFMAGGGFVGQMSSVTDAILTPLGGRSTARGTCATLSNPIVQAGSIVLGIASLFVPGANVVKIAATAAAGTAVSIAIASLPALLADIAAGTTTDNIVGEEAVNAITSASGGLMSDGLAAENGNGPMSKEDTLAYLNLQDQTSDQYIADEVRNTSPFDATNPNTFLGSITASLLPLKSSSNFLTTVGSLINSSFSSIIPTSKAVTQQQQVDSLNVCQDIDVLEAGYAADPFCNVIRGIPPKYLDRDPVEVAESLIGSGSLTEDGEPAGAYKDFIEKCIQNEAPLGYKDAENGYDNATAQSCIINDSNANYYLNFADRRIELGMNDEDVIQEASSAGETNSSIAPPPDTVPYGNGWVLKPGTDYTKYACDPRMDSLGPITVNGFNFTYNVCAEKDSTRDTGCGMRVGINAMTSTNYMNMKEAAAAEGVNMGLADGFRRNNGCETSADSNSRHFHGTAMDLFSKVDGNTICWTSGPNSGVANGCREKSNHQGEMVRWLDANAAKYGFMNLKSEAWHWSTGEN